MNLNQKMQQSIGKTPHKFCNEKQNWNKKKQIAKSAPKIEKDENYEPQWRTTTTNEDWADKT